MKRILVALVAVAVIVVVFLALRGGNGADTLGASGTVEATEADLGFQAGGRIASIGPREGELVREGAVLAQLEVAELEARRSAAEAQLSAARAVLRELERGARPEEVAQVLAAANAAEERLRELARTLDRTRRLYEGGAVSREALEQAETAHEVAQSQAEQAREALALVREGPRRERVEAQRAAVRQAEAAVQQVDALRAQATVRAPFDAIVTVRHREPGEVVSPGLPVLTVMDRDDRWVRIYVREDEIGGVSIGQPAQIVSDTYEDRRFDGRVTFIASEAEFTPRNVQTEEERVKLVYAVKVAIRGDTGLVLKPGIPADVRLLPTGQGVAGQEDR